MATHWLARVASIGLVVCSAAACCWSAASDISQLRTKLSLASSSLAQFLAVHFPRETKDGEMLTNSFTEVKEEPKWGAHQRALAQETFSRLVTLWSIELSPFDDWVAIKLQRCN